MSTADTLETPNKRHIDDFAENIRDLYALERVEGMSQEALRQRKGELGAEIEMFRAEFPRRDSPIQGPARAYLHADSTEDKRPLSSAERRRLRLLKQELMGNIDTAMGRRQEQQAERRVRKIKHLSAWAETVKRLLPPWR